jgi:hypothetical protein
MNGIHTPHADVNVSNLDHAQRNTIQDGNFELLCQARWTHDNRQSEWLRCSIELGSLLPITAK